MNMNCHCSEYFKLYRHIFQKNMKCMIKKGGVSYVFMMYFVNDLHYFQNITKNS